jgi:murein DD-endopeptidase MepM/ murein hydrolase activator NlpD
LKNFIFLLLFTFSITIVIGQSDSIIAIDTINFENENIIVFNNKTWEYSSEMDKLNYIKSTVDTSDIFKSNWTKIIFPYNNEKVPDSVLISFETKYDTFTIPYKNVLTSKFGYRRGGFHKGIDIRLAKGTEVRAAFNGKVRYARYNNGGYGNLVIIRHFNGLETYYAHLSKVLVKENDIIQSGKVIGLGGKTGVEWSGTHLHFEVRYRDLSFDPLKMISLENECLLSDSILLKKTDFHPTILSQRKYHKIRSGDTLSHLARRHNTSVSKILKLNKELTINSTLRIGQRIRVR